MGLCQDHAILATSLSQQQAAMSPDPCTKVGCVIVLEEAGQLAIVAQGCNGFAAGVSCAESRLQRPIKYKFMLHAEADAVAWAAREGRSTRGCSAVVTKFPCAPCCSLLIQSGITGLLTPPPDSDKQWADDYAVSEVMLREAGVQVDYVQSPSVVCGTT